MADSSFPHRFTWLKTNSTLYISNQVQTVVIPELIEGVSAVASTNSAAQTNRGSQFFSGSISICKGPRYWHLTGNVRAVGTNVNLKAKRSDGSFCARPKSTSANDYDE